MEIDVQHARVRLNKRKPKQAKRTKVSQQTKSALTNRAKISQLRKPGIELETACASTKTNTKANANPISDVKTL